ncbi:MAG: TIGR02646 family protein [Marinifilum sp.]|jgi:uncharacterized protein (TIGR02646 family)|nr:TIGR02646 family protein [Marinifilum sp.]
MIKIEKDLNTVPDSLQVPLKEFFFDKSIPQKSKTTHKRRKELIANEGYKNEDVYNGRYKQEDVKKALKGIYNKKCAFCEQKMEQWHVEHYRPKDIYHWLAYSWDNLLFSCATCNQYKGTSFALMGAKKNFENTDENIRKINICSYEYDAVELPKMVNPEVTNPEGHLKFTKDGNVESDDVRFAYTIEECKLDRKHLNDERRNLMDKFKKYVTSELNENIDDIAKQTNSIEVLLRQFIREIKDPETTFIAFRKFAIENGWLNEAIAEVKNN